MNSRCRQTLVLAALISVIVGGTAPAQDQPPQDPAVQAAMAAWQAYGTTGAPHKILLRSVGTWTVDVKYWYAPGTPPEVSKATSEITSWWDGRYVVEKFEGTTPEGPMHGFSISGYDNLKKRFFTTWMDSMSTGLMVAEGTADASGRTMTFNGEMADPPSKSFKRMRSVVTEVDERTRKFEAFSPGPDGKEFKSMEMLYTRK
jgi:hypothetical protein